MKTMEATPAIQSIKRFGLCVKPVDRMSREDLRREIEEMDPIAVENLFGEETAWNTSI